MKTSAVVVKMVSDDIVYKIMLRQVEKELKRISRKYGYGTKFHELILEENENIRKDVLKLIKNVREILEHLERIKVKSKYMQKKRERLMKEARELLELFESYFV